MYLYLYLWSVYFIVAVCCEWDTAAAPHEAFGWQTSLRVGRNVFTLNVQTEH